MVANAETLSTITGKMHGDVLLANAQLVGIYEHSLVILSYLVAIFAAYTTLDLIATIKADPELHVRSLRRFMWQLGAAVVLGGGIWATHLISHLALLFDGAIHVGHVSSFVGFSLLITSIFAYAAVWLLTHVSDKKRYILAGGVVAGLGMSIMHYTGAEAFVVQVVTSYEPRTYVAALLSAIILTTGAVWIGRDPHICRHLHKCLAALLLGGAMCLMHYISLGGASFHEVDANSFASLPPSPHFLALEIALMTVLVVGLALTLSTSTRNKTAQLKLQNDDMRNEIDQRRRTEAELRNLNERLQQTMAKLVESEKLASIGQLAAGVAHEINNPVGYINANMETLRESLKNLFKLLDAYEKTMDECPEHKKKHKSLENLRKQIDFDYLREDLPVLLEESMQGLLRVKNIIQDLRTFSHVDRKTFEVADVNQLVETTINIIGSNKYRQGVITRKLGKLPHIECVPQQIEQVLLNLVSNALHAIDKNPEGRILIETRAQAEDDAITLVVHDNGIGIPPENIKRLYDPFFTTKKVGEGTGLGLSISYNIIREHNGHIDVASEVGKGTIFTVTLPATQPEATKE